LEKALGLPKKLRAGVGSLTAFAFFWSCLSMAPSARAATGGSVALVPIAPVLGGASEKVSGQISAMLTTELGKSDTLRLVPLGGGSTSVAPPSDGVTEVDADSGSGDTGAGSSGGIAPFQGAGERVLAQGKGLIARAEREMRRLRFDAASQDLASGISAVESSFDSLENFQVLVDAYLALAIAKLRLGSRDEGEAALEAVVRLSPDLSLSRGHFPAVFVRMHREAHDRVIGRQGTLVVASTVPGQSVSLDGRDAGPTPATLKVVAGRHFVVVRSNAGQVAYRVDVPEGGEVHVGGGGGPSRHVIASAPSRAPSSAPAASSGDLKTVRDEIRANLIDGPGDEAMRRLARAAGAQFLVVGGLHTLGDAGNLGLDLFLYAAGPDQLSPLPRITLDSELLGAQIQMYKAVQALAAKANPRGFPDALTLPAPVAGDYNPTRPHQAGGTPVAQVETKPPPSQGASSSGDDDDDTIPIQTGEPKPKGTGEARAGTKPHTVEASDVDASVLEAPPKEDTGKKGGGLGTWGIVGITALAVVAVGVGTYFTVAALTAKPSSGQWTANWTYP